MDKEKAELRKSKTNKKPCKTTQSADPRGMEQETELCPPPSPTACGSSGNCFPKITLSKKEKRKGEKQRKREEICKSEMGTEQFHRENIIRCLEEKVKHNEMVIASFHARGEKLKKIKEKIARKEQKTLAIEKRDKNLTRELQAMKERLMQKEKQRKEEKVTNQNSMEVAITVSVEEEMARRKHIERKELRRAKRMKKLSPHRQKSSRPEKEAQRWSSEESVIDGIQQESAVQELWKPKPSTSSPSDRSTHPTAEDRVRNESGAVPQEAGPQPQAFAESEAQVQASETLTRIQTDGSVSAQTAEEKTAWSGHDGGGAVCIEVDTEQVEPAARRSFGSQMLQRVLSSVQSLVQHVRVHFTGQQVQAEDKKEEDEQVSPPRKLIALGAPTGVLTVHLKTCSAFGKNAPVKKGTWATVRVTIEGMVKYSVQQPYNDPMCFNEWKHFSLQIQEEVFGVKQSSLVVVELVISDPDTAAPRIIGRDSIKLQEILKKSSVNHKFDLRLGHQKVCKLDAELAFTYGSLGYGYSHQIIHAGRTMENLVENSLFPRCPPDEAQSNVITPSTLPRLDIIPSVMQDDTSRGTESRISAGLMDCIQRRDRLSQLRKGLEECETGEDRVQFLEKLILRKSFSTSFPSKKNGGF